jgi:dihydrofolate synthase/folylpolyglutamate synthase
VDFTSSLDYLYGLQRFGVKLGLGNMQALKARLPQLQEPLPCIHVAGTNGKGSVSALLAEILKQSGLHVGLYTSPHLNCFSERIRINGIAVTRDDIGALAATIRQNSEDIPLTFFEATTAMALLAFREAGVDIAVIETGLGGRLDATNIVEPLLCLITPISFDHSEHLGSTLAEIAAEKAGIIKPGVPVVVGAQKPVAEEALLTVATARGSQVSMAGRDFSWQGGHDKLTIIVGSDRLHDLKCALAGTHQLDNFAQAVAGAMQLRKLGFEIPDAAIAVAGGNVFWPGRLEWCADSRILLDVSHNAAGIACLADYLELQNIKRIHLVSGLSGGRSPTDVLMPLVKYAVAVYAVPVSYGQSVPPSELASWADDQNLPVFEYAVAADGLAAACEALGRDEYVVVCGSLYLVAELRQGILDSLSQMEFVPETL